MRNLLLFSMLAFAVSTTSGQTGIITTVAGTGSSSVSGDGGPAVSAGINAPSVIVFDRWGNYYFCTPFIVLKVDTFGIITRVAGTGASGSDGDGGPAIYATFRDIGGCALDSAGNIYISDALSRKIRKIDAATGIISTFAGTGIAGFSGDGGAATAAQLNGPIAGCFDSVGNYYFADKFNLRIRKIDRFGIISTFVGTGTWGSAGDGGPANLADINVLYGTCTDKRGNLFITDGVRIRKINLTTNIISTVAGNGTATTGGNGGPAIAAGILPSHVYVDTFGNIFICSKTNHDIRMVDTFGIIHLVAGTGVGAFGGDGGMSDTARLWAPRGMAKDRCGNLLICDNGNFRIRKVSYNPHCWPLDVPDTKGKPELSVYPNPATATLHIAGAEASTTYVLYAVTGQVVATGMLLQRDTEVDINHLAPGLYLLQLQDASGVRSTHKVVKE